MTWRSTFLTPGVEWLGLGIKDPRDMLHPEASLSLDIYLPLLKPRSASVRRPRGRSYVSTTVHVERLQSALNKVDEYIEQKEAHDDQASFSAAALAKALAKEDWLAERTKWFISKVAG